MLKLKKLRAAFSAKNIDGVAFFDENDRGFFSGFWSSAGIFCVFKKSAFLFVDARYFAAARDFFQNSEIKVLKFFSEKSDFQIFFADQKIQKLGVDFSKISVAHFQKIKKLFGVKIVNFSAEKIRAEKSKAEIAATKKACEIADAALLQSLKLLKVGISEREFAFLLEKIGRENGADGVSFPPIVAFGKNSARPHHEPTDEKLKSETPILIDWGFQKNHFCSDETRNFWFGKKPSKKWLEFFEKISAAQKIGISKMKIGENISAPQKVAEKYLNAKIPHSFGHGVGVEVHEFPTISPKTRGKFGENFLVTAEPGLYFDGEFGIRVEDLLVISKSGAQNLTNFPKDLSSAILKDFF